MLTCQPRGAGSATLFARGGGRSHPFLVFGPVQTRCHLSCLLQIGWTSCKYRFDTLGKKVGQDGAILDHFAGSGTGR